MATAAAKTIATLGGAPVEQQASCPSCTIGYPVPVSGDGNGTIYKCFACGFGYGVPATKAEQAAEMAGASIELSQSKLAALARRNGIEPADFGSKDELHAAMVAAGKKGAGD